jgi:hypothetical protein
MRTTIDIPDDTYRNLKVKAALEGTSVRLIVLRGIQRELEEAEKEQVRKLKLPLIQSTREDKLVIDSEKIYDLIDFP